MNAPVPAPAVPEPDAGLRQLLMEAAFTAASRGDVARADLIAQALVPCLPAGAPGPLLARGLARLEARRGDEACALLRQGWEDAAPGEDREVLGGFLLLALQLAGRTLESERLRALSAFSHPIARALQAAQRPTLMEAFRP